MPRWRCRFASTGCSVGRPPCAWAESAVLSSAIFFLATNFAVWQFGGIYPTTGAGLVQCYAAGLPFLKYLLAGDLVWSTILFGAYRLATLPAGERLPSLGVPRLGSG